LTEPTLSEKRSELIGGLGILALIMVVIGGIWLGWFTPTEAAAFGVICALIIGIIKGMRTDDIIQSLYQAGRTTAPIMFLLIAAQMYSRLLALGGGSELHPRDLHRQPAQPLHADPADGVHLVDSWNANRQYFDHPFDSTDLCAAGCGDGLRPSCFRNLWYSDYRSRPFVTAFRAFGLYGKRIRARPYGNVEKDFHRLRTIFYFNFGCSFPRAGFPDLSHASPEIYYLIY